MVDFWNDLFQIFIFLAILIWYIFAFFRRAKRARSSPTTTLSNRDTDSKETSEDSLFGSVVSTTQKPLYTQFGEKYYPTKDEERNDEERNYDQRNYEERNDAQRNEFFSEMETKDLEYETEPEYLYPNLFADLPKKELKKHEGKKEKKEKKDSPQKTPQKILKPQNLLVFSDKPLVQAIVISEVLGKPLSEKTDTL